MIKVIGEGLKVAITTEMLQLIIDQEDHPERMLPHVQYSRAQLAKELIVFRTLPRVKWKTWKTGYGNTVISARIGNLHSKTFEMDHETDGFMASNMVAHWNHCVRVVNHELMTGVWEAICPKVEMESFIDSLIKVLP